MSEPTELQMVINGQKFLTALEGKKMHIYKKGKIAYTNLFIFDAIVYASSIREEDQKIIGAVIITNFKILGRKEIFPTDKIKIIQVLSADVIGEIVGS